MKMIKITNTLGYEQWINPDNITTMELRNEGDINHQYTAIFLADQRQISTRLAPDELIDLINHI